MESLNKFLTEDYPGLVYFTHHHGYSVSFTCCSEREEPVTEAGTDHTDSSRQCQSECHAGVSHDEQSV